MRPHHPKDWTRRQLLKHWKRLKSQNQTVNGSFTAFKREIAFHPIGTRGLDWWIRFTDPFPLDPAVLEEIEKSRAYNEATKHISIGTY